MSYINRQGILGRQINKIGRCLCFAFGIWLLILVGAGCSNNTPATTLTPTTTPVSTPTIAPAFSPTPQPTTIAPTCIDYLELTISTKDWVEDSVVTSYQCGSLYVDSTSTYPARTPSVSVMAGVPLSIQFNEKIEVKPTSVELRLYPIAGVYGSFMRWPDELPNGEAPVDTFIPDPDHSFMYTPSETQGPYTILVRAQWEGPVDVFYALSIEILEGVAIYLPGTDIPVQQMPVLSHIDLADKPLISAKDIIVYRAQTHEIELTEEAHKQITDMEVPVSGKVFLVCVNHSPVYWGAFWTMVSSISYDGVVIVQPWQAEANTIRIEIGYPGSTFFSGTDPRSDESVINALRKAGKLE